MRRFFRSKLFISVILLIMAAVLTFVLLPKLYGSQSETINVVQFIDNVKVGTRITPEMLTTKTIGRYGVDSSVIKTKEEIVGMYAENYIRRDSNLYKDQFVETFEQAEGAADTLLQAGNQITTVSIPSNAAGVAGKIKPGMYVDIYIQKEKAEDDYSDAIEMELPELLRRVCVYSLENASNEDITALERQYKSLMASSTSGSFDSSMIPATVSLITTSDAQRALLAKASREQTIHMSLHPSGIADTAEQPSDTDLPEAGSEVDAEGNPIVLDPNAALPVPQGAN